MMKPQYLVEIAGKELLYDDRRQTCGSVAGLPGGNPAGYRRSLVLGSVLSSSEWDEGLVRFSRAQRGSATLWRLDSTARDHRAPDDRKPVEPMEPKSVT